MSHHFRAHTMLDPIETRINLQSVVFIHSATSWIRWRVSANHETHFFFFSVRRILWKSSSQKLFSTIRSGTRAKWVSDRRSSERNCPWKIFFGQKFNEFFRIESMKRKRTEIPEDLVKWSHFSSCAILNREKDPFDVSVAFCFHSKIKKQKKTSKNFFSFFSGKEKFRGDFFHRKFETKSKRKTFWFVKVKLFFSSSFSKAIWFFSSKKSTKNYFLAPSKNRTKKNR